MRGPHRAVPPDRRCTPSRRPRAHPRSAAPPMCVAKPWSGVPPLEGLHPAPRLPGRSPDGSSGRDTHEGGGPEATWKEGRRPAAGRAGPLAPGRWRVGDNGAWARRRATWFRTRTADPTVHPRCALRHLARQPHDERSRFRGRGSSARGPTHRRQLRQRVLRERFVARRAVSRGAPLERPHLRRRQWDAARGPPAPSAPAGQRERDRHVPRARLRGGGNRSAALPPGSTARGRRPRRRVDPHDVAVDCGRGH